MEKYQTMKSRLPKLTPEKIALMHFLNSNPETKYHVQFCFKSISKNYLCQFVKYLTRKNFDINLLTQNRKRKYSCFIVAYFVPNAENLNTVVGFSKKVAMKFDAHFFGWKIAAPKMTYPKSQELDSYFFNSIGLVDFDGVI